MQLSVQFAEQFKDLKEAARLVRDKSQEKFELLSPALNITTPQVNTPPIGFKQNTY